MIAAASPYEQIRALYLAHAEPEAMTWEELVGWHLTNPLAHVVKHPDFFVMGRAVNLGAGEEKVLDLTHEFMPHECDAWLLYAFAGDKQKAWRTLPYSLPWLCWQRMGKAGNELHYLRTSALRKHTHGLVS